jgi:hypothetical protein
MRKLLPVFQRKSKEHFADKKVAKLVNSDGVTKSYDAIIQKLNECFIKSVIS